MSYFKILSIEELTPEARPLFQEVINKFQSALVFYRILAVAPTLQQAYWYSYLHVLETGTFPLQLNELISLSNILIVEIEPEIDSYLHDHQLSIGFS